jgi:hypothetical protein
MRFFRNPRQAEEDNLLGLPPGMLSYYEPGQRTKREAEARKLLDERSARKGWNGRWPCYVAFCAESGGIADLLHEPRTMTLMIAARASETYKVRFARKIGDTGLVAACAQCRAQLRRNVMFDDEM